MSYQTKAVKIVFAGQSAVGKTSIVSRFYRDSIPVTEVTIGAAFYQRIVTRNGETTVLNIWDTSGLEKFFALGPLYFRNASYCILVFDLTDTESFKRIDKWKRSCDGTLTEKSNPTQSLKSDEPGPYYFLVGNKVDKGSRRVSTQDIQTYCKNNNITCYTETSAITGEGIATLYDKLVDHIYQYQTAKPGLYSGIQPLTPNNSTSLTGCAC
jgi:small GTP-binding protein